jgi:hypothetical protein
MVGGCYIEMEHIELSKLNSFWRETSRGEIILGRRDRSD